MDAPPEKKKLILNCLVAQKEALQYTQCHDENRRRLHSRQATKPATEQRRDAPTAEESFAVAGKVIRITVCFWLPLQNRYVWLLPHVHSLPNFNAHLSVSAGPNVLHALQDNMNGAYSQ